MSVLSEVYKLWIGKHGILSFNIAALYNHLSDSVTLFKPSSKDMTLLFDNLVLLSANSLKRDDRQ